MTSQASCWFAATAGKQAGGAAASVRHLCTHAAVVVDGSANIIAPNLRLKNNNSD